MDIDTGHLNRTRSGSMESLVDQAYLGEMIQAIRAANMDSYFPELGSARDAPEPAP